MKDQTITLLLKKEKVGIFSVEMHVIQNKRTGNETFHIYLNREWLEILYTRVYSEQNAELIYNYYKQCIETIANPNGKCETKEGEQLADTTNSTMHEDGYRSSRK